MRYMKGANLTETSHANMRYTKSLTPSPSVARPGASGSFFVGSVELRTCFITTYHPLSKAAIDLIAVLLVLSCFVCSITGCHSRSSLNSKSGEKITDTCIVFDIQNHRDVYIELAYKRNTTRVGSISRLTAIWTHNYSCAIFGTYSVKVVYVSVSTMVAFIVDVDLM